MKVAIYYKFLLISFSVTFNILPLEMAKILLAFEKTIRYQIHRIPNIHVYDRNMNQFCVKVY